MSQLTLANVNTFIQSHIPSYPQLKTGTHLNLVLEEIYERLNQIEYLTFTTRAPTTTGTVSVTNDSTAVTFSASVLLTTDGLRVVQIGDDATWYVVTRTSDTVGVLSSKYAGTTNATATHKIAYPTVTLPAAVGVMLAARRESFAQLDSMAASDLEVMLRAGTTGQPLYYTPYAFDAAATPDDATRYLLRPFPDAIYAFEYSYLARPTLIDPAGADSQKIPVPTSFRQVILYGTLALCWLSEDRENNPWEAKAEMAMRKALAHGSVGQQSQRRGAYSNRRQTYAIQDTPS